MPLAVTTGHASLTGARARNEDHVGMVLSTGAELEAKGVLLALADGVSGNGGGREAAEYTVRGLLSDYYATPETWGTTQALDRVLNAINRWLIAQGAAHRELSGMATTLSALVLHGARYTLAHVGDSRVYRWRAGALTRLTVDHVWDRPDMRHVLTRAIGLDAHLSMDYAEDDLRAGDVFVLVSDGVWEPLGDRAMGFLLERHSEPEAAANILAREALARGGLDNASALVVRIDATGATGLPESLHSARRLPLPPRLKPGAMLDGFEIIELLHDSRATLLYKARLGATGQLCALKTLQPALENDAGQRAALMAEEWLGRRVLSHYFPQVLPQGAERNTLYYAMSFHEGATLQARLDQGAHFAVADTVGLGIRMMKGLGALHRLDILHRDIKPANLHLGSDDKLRILDLGVAQSRGNAGPQIAGVPGTPSYMAPELIAGEPASAQSDLYAAGVSLYHLLTRHYPYGEVEPFQRPRFGEPVPPSRYRPDIPRWLDLLLLKAVARDRKLRFETAEEMLLALEQGEHKPVLPVPRTPLLERDRVWLWRSIAIASVVVNLLLIYLLLIRKG
ncbi:MAG: serine/threonine protein phosphatase [Betaproteobacteria bacterium RIFCSPLOWO2_02_FULL_62_17]|nr:MAG: serine/threonine protein phosphatase [Betaproteobacteria bacterium RIFCSPLOWO2_02_FULL_62_17]